MEYLLLPAVTIRLKDLLIGSAQLGNHIISDAKQKSTSIDRQGHGDWDISFDILKSGTSMQIIGFVRKSDDGIPPRNIGIFNLFSSVALDFSDRNVSWHGAAKSESENSGCNS